MENQAYIIFEIRNSVSVARPGKVYILGGCCNENHEASKTISIFENDAWQKHYGELKQRRINFLTIIYGTDVMVIGGTARDETK